MSIFKDMVNEVAEGAHPLTVVEANVGQERQDDFDSEAAKEAAFRQIAGQVGMYNGYVGPDWISRIADQVRGADPEGINDLVKMAQDNRAQYEGTARIDSQGSWDMWDNILRGLLACRTEQLPSSC